MQFIFFTTSHVRIKGSHNKIIITIVTSYTRKYHLSVALHTDGNKLVVFPSITLYYDDTGIIHEQKRHAPRTSYPVYHKVSLNCFNKINCLVLYGKK